MNCKDFEFVQKVEAAKVKQAARRCKGDFAVIIKSKYSDICVKDEEQGVPARTRWQVPALIMCCIVLYYYMLYEIHSKGSHQVHYVDHLLSFAVRFLIACHRVYSVPDLTI